MTYGTFARTDSPTLPCLPLLSHQDAAAAAEAKIKAEADRKAHREKLRREGKLLSAGQKKQAAKDNAYAEHVRAEQEKLKGESPV